MAAAAVAYPPWVLLEHSCSREVQGCSSSIADTNTLASCRTTSGHPINVALCLAAPPEGSRVCVQLPAGVEVDYAVVLAAHGDSVEVQIAGINNCGALSLTKSTDHFVYSAGDADAEPPRPPSLSLLPPHRFTYDEDKRRAPECDRLHSDSTGILCHGEGNFLVAELKMEYVMEGEDRIKMPKRKDAALHLLRSGFGEWYVKMPAIRRYADGGECVDLASSWRNNIVIPVGDQKLCWVDMERGLLFSDDILNKSPSLRYVPLPKDANFGKLLRDVCATANGSMIKFVNVVPRCCCGGAGKSTCLVSHHAYIIHTWTLRMDDMTWAMDDSLDATQLWALDGYNGLRRVELDNPVVSMDEPHAICFVVCEKHHEEYSDSTAWRIMVDMKSKTLRSVFCCPDRRWCDRWNRPLPSMVSKYFNLKPASSQPPLGPAAHTEAMQNLMNTRIMQAASPELTILAAVQEIPGLDRDDMLKAYRILTHDDSGRRFRSLMGLPMNLRKDCVLMEIKASEACVLCSACSADFKLKE